MGYTASLGLSQSYEEWRPLLITNPGPEIGKISARALAQWGMHHSRIRLMVMEVKKD